MKNKVTGRAALGFGLAWVLAVGSASFTLQGCANDTAGESKAKAGVIDLALTGTSMSGTIYRLRDAQIDIMGASTLSLSTEDYLNQTQISLELPAGGYLADLLQGWRLERSLDGGMTFADVPAILLSTDPLPFTVFDQQTTDVRLVFRAGDDVVELGNGRAIISIDVIDENAPPPPEGCVQACDEAQMLFPECSNATFCVDICGNLDGLVAGTGCEPLALDYMSCAEGMPGDTYVCQDEIAYSMPCEPQLIAVFDCVNNQPPPMCDVDADGDGVCVNEGDCDDSDPNISPGAPEICGDGIDQNCDGADDACIPQSCFDACAVAPSCPADPEFCPHICGNLTNIIGEDPAPECVAIAQSYMSCAQNQPGDSYICSVDGYPIAGACEPLFQDLLVCLTPPCDSDADMDGWCVNQGDCDDADPNVNPAASEVCGDGIDQNCNGADNVCAPANWSCNPNFFGTNDGCDCGCGEFDPDCGGDVTVNACQFCGEQGSCNEGAACPGNIDPNANAFCL